MAWRGRVGRRRRTRALHLRPQLEDALEHRRDLGVVGRLVHPGSNDAGEGHVAHAQLTHRRAGRRRTQPGIELFDVLLDDAALRDVGHRSAMLRS